ncbi:MAG: universal stress protein [Solirubrobacteraceae bacterium]
MSEKIVVGTDGSDTAKRAVTEAVRIAKGLGAELHVVAGSKSWRDARIVGAPEGARQVYGSMHDAIPGAIIDEAVAQARAAGVTGEGHVVDRDGADALLAIADQVDANMIVVGSKGMTGGRRLLGSVPNQVSHEAHCNVLIVHTK